MWSIQEDLVSATMGQIPIANPILSVASGEELALMALEVNVSEYQKRELWMPLSGLTRGKEDQRP